MEKKECKHEIPTVLGIGTGDIGISLYGEPPEKGYVCAKCGEYVSERDTDATIEFLYKVIKEKDKELDKAREEGENNILNGRIRIIFKDGYKYTINIKKEKFKSKLKE